MKVNNFISIILFGGVCVILYLLNKKIKEKGKEKKESKSGKSIKMSYKDFVADETVEKHLDKKSLPKSSLDRDLDFLTGEKQDFIDENKFHPDYSELISIIEEYNKGSIFNIANQPVLRVMDAEKRDVWPWANKFIFQMSERAAVTLKMIDIFRVKKFITEDETKYQFDLVIQKEGPTMTKVKMILRVSCVFKFNYADEGAFFKAHTDLFKPTPELDEIFIVGYSTGYYDILSERHSEYYAFNNLQNDEVIDQETIRKTLRRKRFQLDSQTRGLNILFDEDGREFANLDEPDNIYSGIGTPIIERCN